MRTQLKHCVEFADDEQTENERQKQAVLMFQKRYAKQRPGLRLTAKGIAIFFGEIILVAFCAWLLITLLLSLV